MSITDRITRTRQSVSFDVSEDLITDAQIRDWTKTILDLCNQKFAFETQADVDIVSGDKKVLLPIDYNLAAKNDLLAIEFPNAIGNFSLDAVRHSNRLPQLKRIASTRGALPSPQFKSENLYGVSRKYLVLTETPTVSVTRTLRYKARFRIEDARWEITVKALPVAAETIVITITKQDGEVVTKAYNFVAPSILANDDVVIGSNQRAIAYNLAKTINDDTSETSLKAEVKGWIVSITGQEQEMDITVESESSAFQVQYFEALDNTDSNVSARVQQYLEGRYKEYIVNGALLPLGSDVIRELSAEAKDLLALSTSGLR